MKLPDSSNTAFGAGAVGSVAASRSMDTRRPKSIGSSLVMNHPDKIRPQAHIRA